MGLQKQSFQKSLFKPNEIPIASQNEKIEIRNGKEFCKETGKRVFRTKGKRPYILIDDEDTHDVNYFEMGILYLAFLRRIVQDASGEELFDNTLTEIERSETRKYLINGHLSEYGYQIFEYQNDSKKRMYEKKFTRFVQTKEKQYSDIMLKDICAYVEKDLNEMKQQIQTWKDNNWSKNHEFYKNVMEATKGVAGD